jgi:hypothetical protein
MSLELLGEKYNDMEGSGDDTWTLSLDQARESSMIVSMSLHIPTRVRSHKQKISGFAQILWRRPGRLKFCSDHWPVARETRSS